MFSEPWLGLLAVSHYKHVICKRVVSRAVLSPIHVRQTGLSCFNRTLGAGLFGRRRSGSGLRATLGNLEQRCCGPIICFNRIQRFIARDKHLICVIFFDGSNPGIFRCSCTCPLLVITKSIILVHFVDLCYYFRQTRCHDAVPIRIGQIEV
jgi:hypothetical protein